MQTNTFWLNFGGLSLAVTLKIRPRSPKPIQLCIMSKCYIHGNLVKIHQLVHEILCCTRTFWLKFGSLSPAKTLKNRSRSPKPHLLFIMSQCNIHAHLVEISQPVHEIWCTQALFWLKFGSLSQAMTLKIISKSPKSHQLFIMSQCYIRGNLVKIHPPIHEISCKQECVTLTLTPTPTPTPTPTGSAPKTVYPPPLRWGT